MTPARAPDPSIRANNQGSTHVAREPGATGSAAPEAPAPGVPPRLVPQDLQIVRPAADGLSNQDIAARPFLSPRTVGYHLYKAYPKLGVASRDEIRDIVLFA
ncbi:helix-turn-helix domain-containing protein [Streptosporangium sandarakinum]